MKIELVSGLESIEFEMPEDMAKEVKAYLDAGREFELLFPDYTGEEDELSAEKTNKVKLSVEELNEIEYVAILSLFKKYYGDDSHYDEWNLEAIKK